MAPRKSSRLLSKGFKTKKISEQIEIKDTSSSSEDFVETTTKNGNLRESRSKRRNDESQVEEDEKQETLDPQKDENLPSESSIHKSEDDSENTVSEEETVKTPAKRKRKISSLSTSPRISKKVRECSFIDFKFFSTNGFFWSHWLDRIGCKNLCNIIEVVDERVIREFYEHLVQLDDFSLKSRAAGKIVKITRNDLLECFDMKDARDDERLLSLSKSDIFQELNDGVGSFKEKDIFSTDFELLIRLLHKAVVDCILPKNGSTTTISTEEALIVLAIKKNLQLDIPTMILKHIWRTRGNKPYGNLLMKIFKYKKINLSKNFKPTVGLKKFGEINLKKMGILVSNKLWFSKDGAWYRHSKFSKFHFDWQKIKSLAEGEVLLEAESGAESTGEESRKKNLSSKSAGKEKVTGKKKKSYNIRTGGKFEIREGEKMVAESESESDSEDAVPQPPGETSRSALESELLGIIDKKFDDLRKDLTKSILQVINSKKQFESQPNDQQEEKFQEDVMTDKTPESFDPEALQIIPFSTQETTQQSPQQTPSQTPTYQVAENILHLLQPQQSNPSQHRTFPQRKKMQARKSVPLIESKKD